MLRNAPSNHVAQNFALYPAGIASSYFS